jgi:hypothetical protein
MKKEEWRFVPGYEGLYMISNCGRVKSMNYNHTGKEKLMSITKDTRGYLQVGLSKDNKKKSFKVHILVWDAFGDSPRNGRILQVDHINNDKTDNRIENLQLLSSRENCSKRSLQKQKTSKYTGVSWDNSLNKWKAQITMNKKNKYIGIFTTEKEAAEAYLKAKENFELFNK